MLLSVEILVALPGEEWCAENQEVNLLCFSQVFVFPAYSLIDLLYDIGTSWSPVTFYPLCRKPDPNSNVVVHTPSGVFGSRNLLQNQNGRIKGSRLVLTKKIKLLGFEIQPRAGQSHEFDSLSAARCRIYSRSNTKVCIWGSHLIVDIGLSFILKYSLAKRIQWNLVLLYLCCCWCFRRLIWRRYTTGWRDQAIILWVQLRI